mmetsp:Transcript_6465/g.9522  ORF Transcript_6465/g.9522 Transcript_6465/m.9522 type:complete len:394 (+) Transcript_6465:66-1247(+)|eukprot:CAMPEP_0194209590 /NCGR_PEP_ID=MMETSP0156-20130528/7663_1 /TAXON_ID=33649 /ORGANISM="Thalassionema nitzschioides, Strain L26-B" /LENGTH=393 /DNA_ID=CAMNT_0038936787 /DNA_START=55 /DNA_END=1236 /DNA_ORIENTATION=-
MSSNDSDSDNGRAYRPSFSRYGAPMNINPDMDDDDIGDETTRRVGGATFTPTFAPVSIAPPEVQPDSISVLQSKAPVVETPNAKFGWDLRDAPTLPEFHPLDRASVFCPHTSVDVVANRIAKTLYERSVEGNFDNEKAKVKCLTSYNVEFRIFVYRGQDHYSHGVIVEVQRRSGASVLFVQDSQAILDAVQGKIPAALRESDAEAPLVSDTEDDNDDAKVALSSLNFVEKMLAYERSDATLLGLQTLSSLTDPAKMGAGTSSSVSTALVTDGNVVGGKVFNMITTRRPNEDELDEQYDLAVSITANVLRNVKGEISSFHRETLRPILIRDLEKAEKKPQRSYTAARCLEPLIAKDHCPTDLYVALEAAKSVGEVRHNALRVQADKCMRLIDEL